MSFKVTNLRLELEEPEDDLPRRIGQRLGVDPGEIVRWRILRKSLDARSHDDIHQSFAAEVELPAGIAERLATNLPRQVERFVPEGCDWPEPGRRRLDHRPVIVG